MAWIESHQELRDHPKTWRLAATLGVSRAAALGHLHMLWWWALAYADHGNLGKFSNPEIAAGAGWDGDPDDFVDAIGDCGWLDEGLLLHDWYDYAGKLVERREKDRERKRDSRRTSAGRRKDGVRTQPNPTQPTKPKEATTKVERTALKDAIAAWWTGTEPPFSLTVSEWGRVEKAAKELADLDATPNDVADRGSRWWKDMTKSPQGLVNNWSQLAKPVYKPPTAGPWAKTEFEDSA